MRRLLFIFGLVAILAVVVGRAFAPEAQSSDLAGQVLATPASIDGFARANEPIPFSFPADFGPHPEYQTEWWYYTGNLDTADGRHFGYQLTFFRRALLPAEISLPRSSEWATNQIYMAHFALTDVEGGEFYAFERFARGAAGLAGALSEPYEVWLEDWRIDQTGASTFTMFASAEGVRVELELRDDKGPVLQGDDGYSQKGPEPGNASYYYSQTRLRSEGEVQVGDEVFAVSGLSWKDHEYSTTALAADQVGWDWFSIQLDDGYELMLFQIRRADGSIDPFSSGELIAPDGRTTHLAASDLIIEPTGEWRSPHSDATYPMGWQLSIPKVSLELQLRPFLEDQELNVSFVYWEGAVEVSGSRAGHAVSGVGYVEMTGYAESIGGQF
jgi:predicted secreted hydrolase